MKLLTFNKMRGLKNEAQRKHAIPQNFFYGTRQNNFQNSYFPKT